MYFIKTKAYGQITISNVIDGQDGQSAINIVLSNESQNIPCTNNGIVSEQMLIDIEFSGYLGLKKVPTSVVVGLLPSGVTLASNTSSTSINDGLIKLNVSKGANLGSNNILNGKIKLTFTVEKQKVVKEFSWCKTKDGAEGSMTIYELISSTPVLNKEFNNSINPNTITFQAFTRKSNSITKNPYNGMFIIKESTNGSTYTTRYTSSMNESTKTYTLSSNTVKTVQCVLCEANKISNQLDIVTVPVLSDESIKNEIEEVKTTISGVSSKVDAVGKSITNKVWQTDITTQINNYDGTTVKNMRDQITEQKTELGKITDKVSDVESTFSDGLNTLTERVAKTEHTADEFKQTVEKNYATKTELGNTTTTLRSEIKQSADTINQTVTDLEGNVSTHTQKIGSLETSIKNTQGELATVKQTANSVKTEIENARGGKTSLDVRIDGIESNVNDNKGNISKLQQTATELSSTVQNHTGSISSLQQRASDIELSVSDVSDNLANNYYTKTQTDAKIKVESDRIDLTVSKVEVVEKSSITSSIEQFYLSTSPTSLSGGSWSTTQPTWTQGKYIWRRTLITKGDGTTSYTPSSTGVCITGNTGATGAIGATGVGIKSITNYYLATSSANGVTISTSGWTTTVQTISDSKKYLWNYEKITYTNNSTISTTPCIIGTYGDKGNTGAQGQTGATGNGIKSIEEYYQISASNTTAPTSWVTTVPTLTATNKYLWNYEKITYTNGTTKETAKRVIGVYGDKGQTGAAGKGIKSTAITYQASTSGTTAPTGTWTPSIPVVSQGQYLWSRTVITYTDNTTSTTYSVAYIPKNGQTGATGSTGATGTGVSSITQQYYLSTSKTTQTGGSWVTSMPTWSSGKYLWTRYAITYTNPSKTEYTSPICDSSWEAVNEVQIGGRNIVKNSNFINGKSTGWTAETGTLTIETDSIYGNCLVANPNNNSRFYYNTQNVWKINTKFAYSFMAKSSISGVKLRVSRSIADYDEKSHTLTTEWMRYTGVINCTVTAEAGTLSFNTQHSQNPAPKIYITNIKLEIGNKPTDWSPAPEDFASVETEKTASDALSIANSNNAQIIESMSRIEQLADQISTLVTDENGNSLMTQTSEGWKFNISGIQKSISDTINNLNKVEGDVDTAEKMLNTLQDITNDISKKTAYIDITTANGQPAIILGQSDSAFKLRITNTSIDFLDGSSRVAYISNKVLYIEKAIIKDELQIGDGIGYIWKRRSNGNIGLRYSGTVNRNLARNSNKVITNNAYQVAVYSISPLEGTLGNTEYGHMIAGNTYTITICVTPNNQTTELRACLSRGMISNWKFKTDGTANKQIITATGVCKYSDGKTPSDGLQYADVLFYRFPNVSGTNYPNITIHWVKIERGSVATPYLPATDD